jgi:hypothetical protein
MQAFHIIVIVIYWLGLLLTACRFAYHYMERKTRPPEPPPPPIPWTGRPDDTSEITKDWTGE